MLLLIIIFDSFAEDVISKIFWHISSSVSDLTPIEGFSAILDKKYWE